MIRKYPLSLSLDDEHIAMLDELAELYQINRSQAACYIIGTMYIKELGSRAEKTKV